MVHPSPHRKACIVGAGPYGVSIAAYLRFVDIDFRIFGSSMRRWLSQMPKQMLLKSESSCASSLYEPTGVHTLSRDIAATKAYQCQILVHRFRASSLVKYALSFQQTLVPEVEDVIVTSVSKLGDGFELRLSSGEILDAAKVIVATGLDHMAYMPEQIARLPAELRSHTADYYDLSGFKSKERNSRRRWAICARGGSYTSRGGSFGPSFSEGTTGYLESDPTNGPSILVPALAKTSDAIWRWAWALGL